MICLLEIQGIQWPDIQIRRLIDQNFDQRIFFMDCQEYISKISFPLLLCTQNTEVSTCFRQKGKMALIKKKIYSFSPSPKDELNY